MNDQFAAVETIKQGEYVKRKPDARAVYTRGAYDHSERKYELHDTEDMNRSVWVKRGVKLVVGFTY